MGAVRHLRVLHPHPDIFAYYDGRVPGHRFADAPNWVDEGATGLGIASYALVQGDQALVYDTHVSPDHGMAIRSHLEGQGVGTFSVIYSHWHLDHVAGTAAFPGAEVIANARTLAHLVHRREAIEAGTLHGPPAINPLILPSRTFSGELAFRFGRHEVRLIEANIHSDDATVVWLARDGILLAGDTVEDCVTYLDEPADLAIHLADLDRLANLRPKRILPAHGSERIIAAGGYGAAMIPAMQRYIRWLKDLPGDPAAADTPLSEVIAADLAAGTLEWFAPYEDIHAQNVDLMLKHGRTRQG